MRLVTVSSIGTVAINENDTREARIVVTRGGNWPAVSSRGELALPVGATQPGETAHVRRFSADAPGAAAGVPGSELAPGHGVAPGLTHYVYWSPAGTNLLIIQPAEGALELRSWRPGTPASQRLFAGAPIFPAFDDTGSRLAVHHGGPSGARLVVLELLNGAPARVCLVQQGVGGFGAPAFCGDGQVVTWAEPAGGGGVRLRAADVGTGRTFPGPAFEGTVRFVPGPVRNHVLVAVGEPGAPAMYGRLVAWEPGAPTVRMLYRGRFLAAWASPASARELVALALPGFSPESRVQPAFIDARGRELGRLAPFVPSPPMQLALAFFDQFGRSHGPWSPGGDWFIVGGRTATDGPFAVFGPPEPDRVLGVVAAEIDARPLAWRVLAEGVAGWLAGAAPGRA